MIGTRDHGPTWGEADDEPRVLVEAPGGRWPFEDDVGAAGLRVITCFGPERNPSCPVLFGEPCALAASADVIVVRNPTGDPRWQRLIASHASLHPATPLAIDTSAPPELSVEDVVRSASTHRDIRRSTPAAPEPLH